MRQPEHQPLISRLLRNLLSLPIVLATCTGALHAQSALAPRSEAQVAGQVDQLAEAVEAIAVENRRLRDELNALQQQSAAAAWQPPTACRLPSTGPPCDSAAVNAAPYLVEYDNGFVIRPIVADDAPFSLKINNQTTFRYTGFAREDSFWIDSAGNVIPVDNSSDLMIPRGRLIFSGKALMPEMSYLLNIDYNTVGSNPIGFRAYSLSYQFGRALELSVGQNKVPGSREWLASSWVAQEGPDRSMATTFFRPSLSQGIWFTGQPLDGLYYHTMLSNGFNTLNRTPDQSNQRFCWSDSVWWEPWGAFGPGYSDIEDHQQPVLRIGSCFTFALGKGSQANSDSPENSSLRLSDGTVITLPGALAPGVTLLSYDISLAAIDAAYKYRGFSLSTEMYLQNLSSLEGNGPLPFNSTRAYGGLLQGGFFVVPRKMELYSRSSFVTGDYGSGTELAGGFNWFLLEGQSNLRFTCDVAKLEDCPADQNRTGFVAGQTGLLIRTQINASF